MSTSSFLRRITRSSSVSFPFLFRRTRHGGVGQRSRTRLETPLLGWALPLKILNHVSLGVDVPVFFHLGDVASFSYFFSLFRCPLSGYQEIIKVREWIPHIGPFTKVIRLKLLLDIVPSSCEDITRAMRGQPKRLTRNYLRKNGGNVILYVLVSFHTRDVFCTLSRLFVQSGISFIFLRVWLFIILPFIRF